MTSKKIKPNTFDREMSNEDYHGLQTYYSSSQLKDALVDIEYFHKLYITREIQKESTPAMDIGTYYHTAILEPEKLKSECVVWDGIRRGKGWLEFAATNKNKIILTSKEVDKAANLISATKDDQMTMKILSNGEAEVSAFATLEGVPIRVRADWVSFEQGYIMDLKSTSGNAKNVSKIQKTMEMYHYDMSAALYVDAFNEVCKNNNLPPIREFYWSFASKDMQNCQLYAASQRTIELGRIKYKRALKAIAEASANGWKFPSSLLKLEPLEWNEKMWKENPEKVFLEIDTKVSASGSDFL